MQPGLVIKLRPTGPWRVGPDSGARNKVDAIYHSDSLYAAVTSAMARLGSLEEWLSATARSSSPAVCFSSCFPFMDEIGFVVPPRTVWPPTSPALMSARVRWKSARFVPLGIVQAILGGHGLDENHWSIDGPSECLVPAGRPGPFRMGVRWNAAVDRLSGATERHSTACIEFRSGAGLWTIVSFADDAARDRWSGPIKAAFRLLADSGFGGERSRGWGRSDAPEFVEGTLPEMILGDQGSRTENRDQGSGARDQGAKASGPDVLPGLPGESPDEPSPVTPIEEPIPAPPEPDPEPVLPPLIPPEPMTAESANTPEAGSAPEAELEHAPDSLTPDPGSLTPAPPMTAEVENAPVPERAPDTLIPDPGSLIPGPHWLLSLFSPASTDTVDWARGNYTVLTRGGRVESPAGSGELKKQVQMVAEGSVLYASSVPRGSAPDVAPEGFAHPVFRAGFALSIRLPEVR
jgi:CRISPR type III-A-associated RAMP protein Csm4